MPEKTDKTVKKIYYDPISIAKRTKQIVYFVEQHDKPAILEQIFKNIGIKQTIVVTKNKRSADELSNYLKSKDMKVTAIHGNHKTQKLEDATKAFNTTDLNILITTDMILQSLELINIQQIVSYDLPTKPRDYLTRVGHLKEIGDSIAFVSLEDNKLLDAIEFLIKSEIEQGEVEGFTPTPYSHTDKSQKPATKDKRKKPRHRKSKTRKTAKAKED